MRNVATLAGGLAVMIGLSGCTTSTVWERNLERTDAGVLAPLDASAGVTVREVSWDRLQATLAEIEDERARSDTHVSEWTREARDAEEAKLLRGLQVSQDPRAVTVVAHSQFRTVDGVGDPDKTLPDIARKAGANMVVYSTRVLGKADKIVQEPVSNQRWGTVWYRDQNDRYRSDTFNEQQSGWVPIRVSADEVGAIAFFLRID